MIDAVAEWSSGFHLWCYRQWTCIWCGISRVVKERIQTKQKQSISVSFVSATRQIKPHHVKLSFFRWGKNQSTREKLDGADYRRNKLDPRQCGVELGPNPRPTCGNRLLCSDHQNIPAGLQIKLRATAYGISWRAHTVEHWDCDLNIHAVYYKSDTLMNSKHGKMY